MTSYEIGRLLRAGTSGFVVGCRVTQLEAPSFGALVRVPLSPNYQVYGLISDIHIDDDGVVRQLVTAEGVDQAVVADNRLNRNIPVEMSVLAVGFEAAGLVHHRLPPRPPLSLDVIYLCDPEELHQFTSAGRFGYFRHVLRAKEAPVGELLAAHLHAALDVHRAAGDEAWAVRATQEIITLLRDDYALLMEVLRALGDAIPSSSLEI
jgi:hypothetical protein